MRFVISFIISSKFFIFFVFIFLGNKAWTVLLRGVYSIMNRSPPHLIEEILLVDDFSDFGKSSFYFYYFVSILKNFTSNTL